ncbi:MAG: helix-turn-helix domain-containing protein [Cellulosilyticaceae bacterium]
MDIGRKIQDLRKDKNITQAALAKAIFKSKRSVENYEANKSDITFNTLQDIADKLGVSIMSILVDDPSEILNIIKEYYNLEDKPNFNIEKDFEMIMKGFIERYKK